MSGTMRRKRILTCFLSTFYGRGGTAPSNEAGIFGNLLFAQMGFEEVHVPMETLSIGRDVMLECLGKIDPCEAIFVVPFQEVESWLAPLAQKWGCPIIVWWCDGVWRQDFQKQWDYAGAQTAAVTTDADNASFLSDLPQHPTTILSNWGIRPDLWRVSPPIEQPVMAASFAGQLYQDRALRLSEIEGAGQVPIEIRDTGRTVMSIADYHRFMAEHVFAIALTKSSHGVRQWKSRHFEAALHGTILVTEPVERLDQFWEPDVECLVFETAHEAQAKMSLLMQDGPEAYLDMSQRAFQRGLREHTMFHRFRDVFDAVRIPVAEFPNYETLLDAPDITEHDPSYDEPDPLSYGVH